MSMNEWVEDVELTSITIAEECNEFAGEICQRVWDGKTCKCELRNREDETVAEMTCPDCKLRVFWSNEFKRYEHHYGNMDKNPMPCPAQDVKEANKKTPWQSFM